MHQSGSLGMRQRVAAARNDIHGMHDSWRKAFLKKCKRQDRRRANREISAGLDDYDRERAYRLDELEAEYELYLFDLEVSLELGD